MVLADVGATKFVLLGVVSINSIPSSFPVLWQFSLDISAGIVIGLEACSTLGIAT
jgi:hypothetical protein